MFSRPFRPFYPWRLRPKCRRTLDPAAQARQVFENLRRCLAQAGATFADVVNLTFFVLDVADLPALRSARDAVIDTARPPASTAVQVAALFAPGYLLEVEAWALVDD
jgi:enamine deaminase RidA (YjgF/YER057c/UK114 family)